MAGEEKSKMRDPGHMSCFKFDSLKARTFRKQKLDSILKYG